MFGKKRGTGWERSGPIITAYEQLTPAQKAEVGKAIAADQKAGTLKGGARDDAKITRLEQTVGDLRGGIKQHGDTVRQWISTNYAKAPNKAALEMFMQQQKEVGGAKSLQQVTADDLVKFVERQTQYGGEKPAAFEPLKAALGELRLREAELLTAKQATPGHPLVNTTDQWTTTALRKLLKQAVDEGADAIALPTAKVIEGYGMGGGEQAFKGNQKFYEEMMPRTLGKLLSKMDPDIKMEKGTLKGHEDKGDFTIFTLTPKAKEEIGKGQPLFSSGGIPLSPGEESDGGSDEFTGSGAQGMADQQADFEGELAVLAQLLAEEGGGETPGRGRAPVELPPAVAPNSLAAGLSDMGDAGQATYDPSGGSRFFNILAYPFRRVQRAKQNTLDTAAAYEAAPPEQQQELMREWGAGVGNQLADFAIGSALPYGIGKVGQGLHALNQVRRVGPALAPTLAGGAALLATSSDTGEGQTGQTKQSPEQTEAIKREQIELKKSGDYTGPIDGQDGPLTTAARAKKIAREAAERKDAIELLKAEAAKQAGTAQAAQAEAEIKAIEAAEIEAQRREAARVEGAEMLRKAEAELPWYRHALRDYGPAIGYGAGVIGGIALKGLTNRAYNAASAAKTARANALLAEGEDIPGRVGRVNQFWSEGQRGAKPTVPFVSKPDNTPPFQSNALAPQSGELYQTGMFAAPGADVGRLLASAGASGLSYAKLQDAQAELKAAYEALDKEPNNEAAMRRLQAAKDMVAIFRTGLNASIAGGTTYLGAMATMPRRPSRPDVNLAEAERLRLDKYLSTQAKRQGKGPPSTAGAKETPGPEPTPTGDSPAPATAAPKTAATAKSTSSPRSHTARSSHQLPEGYSHNPAGRGSQVIGPDGKFVSESKLPKKKPGVQTDDLRPYGVIRNKLDPSDY